MNASDNERRTKQDDKKTKQNKGFVFIHYTGSIVPTTNLHIIHKNKDIGILCRKNKHTSGINIF